MNVNKFLNYKVAVGLISLVCLNTNAQSKNQDTSTDIPNVNSVDAKFNYTSIVLNSGIKYTPTNSFLFYLLGNLGYSFVNTFNVDYNSSDYYVNSLNNKTSYTIDRHSYFGATLMGVYKITDSFRLGGNLIYNIHSMDLEYKTMPVATKERSIFNEYSANVVFMWSLS